MHPETHILRRIDSLDDLFQFMEQYAAERHVEIRGRRTVRPLIKSFVLETGPRLDVAASDLPNVDIVPIDSDWFRIETADSVLGFVETLAEGRFHVIYSLADVNVTTRVIGTMIRKSSGLDYMWLTRPFLLHYWNVYVHRAQRRFTRMKFEFTPELGMEVAEDEWQEDDAEDYPAESSYESKGGATTFSWADRTERIYRALFQDLLWDLIPVLRSPAMVRLPATDRPGGHDLYAIGKVTNRSDSFLDHRSKVRSIVDDYHRTTRSIEERIWLSLEDIRTHSLRGVQGPFKFRGAPVEIRFSEPLPPLVFQKLREAFASGRGPFRIFAKPIDVATDQFHVYGLDLHLMEEIFMDANCRRIVLLLPEGTCGNTIHRLFYNVQKHLDPNVKAFVGNDDYEALVEQEVT